MAWPSFLADLQALFEVGLRVTSACASSSACIGDVRDTTEGAINSVNLFKVPDVRHDRAQTSGPVV